MTKVIVERVVEMIMANKLDGPALMDSIRATFPGLSVGELREAANIASEQMQMRGQIMLREGEQALQLGELGKGLQPGTPMMEIVAIRAREGNPIAKWWRERPALLQAIMERMVAALDEKRREERGAGR